MFYEVETAFETTWSYGILHYLFDMSVKGRLPITISQFILSSVKGSIGVLSFRLVWAGDGCSSGQFIVANIV